MLSSLHLVAVKLSGVLISNDINLGEETRLRDVPRLGLPNVTVALATIWTIPLQIVVGNATGVAFWASPEFLAISTVIPQVTGLVVNHKVCFITNSTW